MCASRACCRAVSATGQRNVAVTSCITAITLSIMHYCHNTIITPLKSDVHQVCMDGILAGRARGAEG